MESKLCFVPSIFIKSGCTQKCCWINRASPKPESFRAELGLSQIRKAKWERDTFFIVMLSETRTPSLWHFRVDRSLYDPALINLRHRLSACLSQSKPIQKGLILRQLTQVLFISVSLGVTKAESNSLSSVDSDLSSTSNIATWDPLFNFKL